MHLSDMQRINALMRLQRALNLTRKEEAKRNYLNITQDSI
jgi:uncharacterized protein YnzC (UPF0291/DUF896 family)